MDFLKKKKVGIGFLDMILLFLLLAVGVYIIYRTKIGLNYKWNWGSIPQYFLYFDTENEKFKAGVFLLGLFTTLRLSIWATVLASIFGIIVGLLRVSQRPLQNMLGKLYVEVVRNIPPIVVIFIFYYFLGDQIMSIFGVREYVRSQSVGMQKVIGTLFAPPVLFPEFLSALMALALFEGAYVAEIIRAGIQSIKKGQWEASYALGLKKWQQMYYVILPQAMRRILPALAGQFISIIKDSSIASVISIQELTFQGTQLMATTYFTIEIWVIIGALYLIMCLLISVVVRKLEVYMSER